MAHDKDGNLLPLMLSDLIRVAQAALQQHGDIPVWVQTTVAGYERDVCHSVPASDPPEVGRGRSMDRYWPGRFDRAFVIDGE